MGHPTCIIEGLACWLTLCILEKIICNSTNSVQISFIETLKLIVFSWTIWWCYWQNVLMINEKNNFLTVSWLSGLLSAEIFISTGEWGVQMPPLTSENSYFLRSGPQGATLVMVYLVKLPSGDSTKPLPEPMLTQICLHMPSLGHNELSSEVFRPKMRDTATACFVKYSILFFQIPKHSQWMFIKPGPWTENL